MKLTVTQVKDHRNVILGKQGGKCAICQIHIVHTDKIPVLDHDHNTGAIRGVLCNNCNGLEGKVINLATCGKRKETPLAWLTRLTAYLSEHLTNRTGLIHPTHKTDEELRILKNAKAVAVRKAKKVI